MSLESFHCFYREVVVLEVAMHMRQAEEKGWRRIMAYH